MIKVKMQGYDLFVEQIVGFLRLVRFERDGVVLGRARLDIDKQHFIDSVPVEVIPQAKFLLSQDH